MSNIKEIDIEKRKHWLALASKSKMQMKPRDLYAFDRRIFDRLRGRSGRVFDRIMLFIEIESECETCKGVGYYDERIGGEFFSNPKAKCPDC